MYTTNDYQLEPRVVLVGKTPHNHSFWPVSCLRFPHGCTDSEFSPWRVSKVFPSQPACRHVIELLTMVNELYVLKILVRLYNLPDSLWRLFSYNTRIYTYLLDASPLSMFTEHFSLRKVYTQKKERWR